MEDEQNRLQYRLSLGGLRIRYLFAYTHLPENKFISEVMEAT